MSANSEDVDERWRKMARQMYVCRLVVRKSNINARQQEYGGEVANSS